jgi:antitoxin FitA
VTGLARTTAGRYHFASFCTEDAMAQILIRDLDPALVERLKARAKRNHRSLQGEVKAILEEASPAVMSRDAMLAESRWWHERLRGRDHTPSVALIREDRDSR